MTNDIVLAGGQAVALQVDVSDRLAAKQMIEAYTDLHQGLDVLVNSAGVIRIAPWLSIKESDWDTIVDVNCKGTLWCSQAAAAVMIAQGRGGRIINIASDSGRRGEEFGLVYCASKASVISMTQSMALARSLLNHRERARSRDHRNAHVG